MHTQLGRIAERKLFLENRRNYNISQYIFGGGGYRCEGRE